jgi:uncharacterized membrane protein (DUF2068 family)
MDSRTGHGGYLGFRIIGLFKVASGLLFLAVGVGLFRYLDKDLRQTVHHAISLLRLDPDNRYIHQAINWVSGLDHKQLRAIQAGTFIYAFLHILEGTGLLLKKRWAGFLTVIITGSLIPLEGYEVFEKYNHIKLAVLVVNVGIVIYLIWKLRQESRDETRVVAEPKPQPAAGA